MTHFPALQSHSFFHFPTLSLLFLLAASAAPAAASEHHREEHYHAGLKSFAAEDYAQAVADFAASMQVRPQASTALYLGNAYLKLGELSKAIDSFKQVLELNPMTPKRDAIRKLIEGMEARNVGVVQITSRPAGATVYLREKGASPYGQTPLDLALQPGIHRLSFELDGYEVTTREVKVTFGETVTLDTPLRSVSCELVLTATPPGSRAAIDGASAVAVPAQVPIPLGDHRVTFSAKGYVSKQSPLHCVSGSPREVLRADVMLVRPNRYALKVALGFTAFAILAEGIALAAHSRTAMLVPGSESYESNHRTELGFHIAAGALAAGALVGYLVELVPRRAAPGKSEPAPVRLMAVPLPQGGALGLSGRF